MHAQTAPAACDGTAHIIADPRTVTATSFFILVIDYTPLFDGIVPPKQILGLPTSHRQRLFDPFGICLIHLRSEMEKVLLLQRVISDPVLH
jgi:hypothetical protein